MRAVLRIVLRFVLLVEILPEAVVHAVRAHLNHHEEIPGFIFEQMAGQGKTCIGHLMNARQKRGPVFCAKIFNVKNVIANHAFDFKFQWSGKSVWRAGVRREKIRDNAALDP